MAEVELKTFSDDKCLGQTAPSLELLEFVRGQKIDLQPNRVHVLYFWVSFYKGAWGVNEEMTQLAEKHPNVTFIAISNDADRAAVEKFLQKIADGLVFDENTKSVFRLDLPYVAYDAKKLTGKMYTALSDAGTTVHVPQAFIIDKSGRVAWRQCFTQSYTVSQSNFADQLSRVVDGGDVDLSNGPKPKPKVDEGEAAEVDGDFSLF